MNAISLSHRQFALAGNCTFTVKSKKTGNHFTFRVERPDEKAPHFVSVLTGPENTSDYSFLGTIFDGATYRHGKKSRITTDAASAKAFDWLWNRIDNVPTDLMEFLPSCSCCRCGRALTNPTSVEMAIGPECAKKI